MDAPDLPSSTCACTCLCCGPASSPSLSWRRSLKRKLEQIQQQQQKLPALNDDDVSALSRDHNEAAVLRETLNSQQRSIQELYEELEEERSASASATSEAMSMILRLQREKAEAQMEFRQFKRFAEEKISHDQEEIAALEDLLFKREQAVQSLTCEIQAYKHWLMSYGFHPNPMLSEPQTPNTTTALAAAAAAFDYLPLICKIPNVHLDNVDEAADIEKYAFGETPRDQIQNLGQRILQMERTPSSSHDKGVVAFSPRKLRHVRRLSMESFGSSSYVTKGEEFPVTFDRPIESDDVSDRVYTVDAVRCGPESYMSTPRDFGKNDGKKDLGGGEDEEEIKRLYVRLQALEADRETMRQTIMSMGTDKAQLVLLKEIAQQLCKKVEPQPQPKQIVKRPSFIRSFSIFTALKWVVSLIFWRKKSSRTKYPFGLTSNNAGLLLLVDKSPRTRLRRCLTRSLR